MLNLSEKQKKLALNFLLYQAVSKGYDRVIKLCIQLGGANIHQRISSQNNTLLHLAILNGHIDTAIQLVHLGISIHTENALGYTPLYYAVHAGSLRLVSFLTNRGADVNQGDQYGNTPLHLAVHRCVKIILCEEELDSTADVEPRLGLINSEPYLQIIEFLLNNHADSTLINNYGNTPLNLAQEERLLDQRRLDPLKNTLFFSRFFKNTIRGNVIFSKLVALGIQQAEDALEAEVDKVLSRKLQYRLDF